MNISMCMQFGSISIGCKSKFNCLQSKKIKKNILSVTCVCVYAQNKFSKQLTTILFIVKIDIHYMYKQKVGSSINKHVSGWPWPRPGVGDKCRIGSSHNDCVVWKKI